MPDWITADYKIAVGHNNAGGLTLITSITVNSVPFVMPLVIPTLTRGVKRFRTDGRLNYAGLPNVNWVFSYITHRQWVYLRTSLEGLVTVRLALYGTTFANYNATLILPDPAEMQYTVIASPAQEGGYTDVIAQLVHLEAI